jgi:hypothetical protein
MKKNIKNFVLFLSVLIISIACGSKQESKMDLLKNSENLDEAEYIMEESLTDYAEEEPSSSAYEQKQRSTSEKDIDVPAEERLSLDEEPNAEVPQKDASKIIKTAEISFQVKNYKEDILVLKKIIKSNNGFISNEKEKNSDTEIRNDIIIRIQNNKFDKLVNEIMTVAAVIDYKNISAEDVTEDYVDLQTRLKTKKKVEERYEAILLKANSIYDILQVERELASIREQIEAVEGRLRYYNDRISYSTINLSVYEVLEYVPKSPDQRFSSKFKKALVSGWRGLINFFIGVLYLWPFWLIVALTWWIIRRIIKRRRKRKQKLQ